MSQLDKHRICCQLKAPQDQTNSPLCRPAVAVPSALYSTRGRSSYLGGLPLLPEEHIARDETQEHRGPDSYSLEGQQGSQNKESVTFSPQHITIHWQDGIESIISHASSLPNVTSISFLFPRSFPGNWEVSAEAVCNSKQDLHLCSHSPYHITKLKELV